MSQSGAAIQRGRTHASRAIEVQPDAEVDYRRRDHDPARADAVGEPPARRVGEDHRQRGEGVEQREDPAEYLGRHVRLQQGALARAPTREA